MARRDERAREQEDDGVGAVLEHGPDDVQGPLDLPGDVVDARGGHPEPQDDDGELEEEWEGAARERRRVCGCVCEH